MNTAFLVLFLMSPQLVMGNLILEKTLPPKLVPIQVRIDFGFLDKPLIEKEVIIKEGTTPRDALKESVSVEEGFVCCKDNEVKGIGGISADPMKNRWWRLKINGSSKNASPLKSHLKAGDVMEWVYFEDAQ